MCALENSDENIKKKYYFQWSYMLYEQPVKHFKDLDQNISRFRFATFIHAVSWSLLSHIWKQQQGF